METSSALLDGFLILVDPYHLFLIFVGTLVGVVVGALPGLGSIAAIAVLIPFTLTMDIQPALILMVSLYCASVYSGAISAILINTPGTASAAATCIDGFPLAQRGEAARALGMATVASTLGGIFSCFIFLAAAPLLARLGYQFGPVEYFALALFGLSMLASISPESSTKNLIAGAFGVLLATVGFDPGTGVERFTFGQPELSEGIHFVPVLVGMFALGEMLIQSERLKIVVERIALTAIKLPSMADYRKCAGAILRSFGIGTFIGVLPAEGGTVASFIAYAEAKRWSKHKDEFGKGAIEGIAAAEAANNAAAGAAMIPTLALGIPGSGTTAVILVAILAHGIQPGPHLFAEEPQFVYAIFFGMLAANVLFLGLGLLGAKVFARLTLAPRAFLWPAVFVLAVVGTYSLDGALMDVWIMVGFGIVGYLFRRFGFSPVPVAMGLILGELVETSLEQALMIYDHNIWLFFTRPIADVFFALTIIGFFLPQLFKLLERRWSRTEEATK